jgi:hypothetical protein
MDRNGNGCVWMDRWMDGLMDGWMDGWMNAYEWMWMNGGGRSENEWKAKEKNLFHLNKTYF